MPTYLYEYLDAKGAPTGETFEIVQMMKDAALTKHPESGKPCRRAITAPAVAGKWSGLNKGTLSDKNLDRLGFTKYQRKGNGYMEKTAGRGPDAISADD
jgi:predicted nucleic acid-binding Zn ribbon protein